MNIIGHEYVWKFDVENNEWGRTGSSDEMIAYLAKQKVLVVDTETTGLRWMFEDKVFSIAIATDDDTTYYINFQKYNEEQLELDQKNTFLPDFLFQEKTRLAPIFLDERTWIAHNLKFDWHMLRKMGFRLTGRLCDTMVRERLLDNDQFSYSLSSCVSRNLPEYKKDDAVEYYIKENGLYDVQEIPGKNQKFTNKYYFMVPFRIIAPYACNDTLITKKLFENQEKRIQQSPVDLSKVITLEEEVMKLCCEIEEYGMRIDKGFCHKAADFESQRAAEVEAWFKKEFGKKFVDSEKALSPIFKELGFTPTLTDKGNESIDGRFLESVPHELARQVEKHRDAIKREFTYFRNFILLSGSNGILHADMKPAGTRTGRFSYSDPNMQNVPAEDESTFPVRRAIIPRPGHFFVMIDYSQQEFRLMLEYAGEMGLIKKINEGHDPHQATADMTGLSRKAAKTLNFGLLYGMGVAKLGAAIGVSAEEAKEFKYKYFGALPRVRSLIYDAQDRAKLRGYVRTWLGRKLDFKNPDFAYKAINGIIQGGCADVTKLAMVKIAEGLRGKYDTRIVLQVHDELVFEVPFHEVEIVGMLQRTMEEVSPTKHMPLTTSLSYSLESLHDAIEVENCTDIIEAIGAHVKKSGQEVSGDTSQHMVH